MSLKIHFEYRLRQQFNQIPETLLALQKSLLSPFAFGDIFAGGKRPDDFVAGIPNDRVVPGRDPPFASPDRCSRLRRIPPVSGPPTIHKESLPIV